MKKNFIVLGIALVAILISSLLQCNRKVTPQEILTYQSNLDSLKTVLDSISIKSAEVDTIIEYQDRWKVKYVTKTDTVYKEYDTVSLSSSFTREDVDVEIMMNLKNSEVLDFKLDLVNNRKSETLLDTIYLTKVNTVHDTVFLTAEPTTPVYVARNLNGGFAIVADPTMSKLAPGLSFSFGQHELLGYYNVLDTKADEKLGVMYRYNFWKNYKTKK